MVHGMVQFPGAGCVVEFMQGNSPQIAWVVEETNGKLRLLLPNRRETNLSLARLLPWSGPAYSSIGSRDAAVELLAQHRDVRASRRAAVDVQELWTLAQGEVSRASAVWFAELSVSDPDIDTVAAYGQALLECKSHFKFQPPEFEVYSEDVVAARLAEQEALRLREELARQGHAWIARLWDVYCAKQPSDNLDAPQISEELARQLKKLILQRLAEPESSEQESQWRLLVKGLPDDPLLPLYLAQAWGLVPAHYNYWMDRTGYAPGDAWSEEHDQAIAELSGKLREEVLPDDGATYISVDSASTRDIDDAFVVRACPEGGWTAKLALACPALCWPFGTPLDKAVLHRATSIYLPEATHHMLPERLSMDVYTLVADEGRPALTLECRVAGDGAVLECLPSLSRVRVADNLTYDAVEAVFVDVPSPASAHREMLVQALELAKARMDHRLRNNAVVIERPEPEFVLEDSPQGLSVVLQDGPEVPRAHLIVSELMILANAALARWAAEHGVALLHRTQDVAVPKDYVGVWREPQDIARVVRALAPASLETSARPHAGLGEAAYAPTTSPLRRYPDLLNEAQIVHMVRHGSPRWSTAELEDLLPLLNARLDAAGQVQRMRPRYWKLLYIRQHGDKCWWPAVITDENDAFVSVSLPREQLFLRARRNLFDERCHPGQRVEVRLHKVNPLRNEIQIAEVREPA